MLKVKANGTNSNLFTEGVLFYGEDNDLNALVESGFYKTNGQPLHQPCGGWLFVWVIRIGGDLMQVAFLMTQPYQIFYRSGGIGDNEIANWRGWTKFTISDVSTT